MSKDLTDTGKGKAGIGYPAICLGLYYILTPLDLTAVSGLGSLLRLFALIPSAAILLNLDRCTLGLKESLLLILYALYKLLSITYTVFPVFTMNEVPRIISNFGLVFILGSLYRFKQEELEFLKKSLFIASIITIFFIIIFADFSAGGRLTIRTSVNEVDHNYLTGYLLFLVPVSVRNFLVRRRYLSLLPILTAYIIFIMTGSRGGLLAIILVTLLSGWGALAGRRDTRSLIRIVIFLLAGALGLIIAIGFLDPEVLERFSPDYMEENGTSGRKDIWIYLFKVFLHASPMRQLFGHGAGTTAFVNRMNTRMGGHVAHNVWVDELTTGGLIGLFLLILLHFAFLIIALKCRDVFTASVYAGFLIMCMNLSIVAFKPMLNVMILIMLIHKNQQLELRKGRIPDDHIIQTKAT